MYVVYTLRHVQTSQENFRCTNERRAMQSGLLDDAKKID